MSSWQWAPAVPIIDIHKVSPVTGTLVSTINGALANATSLKLIQSLVEEERQYTSRELPLKQASSSPSLFFECHHQYQKGLTLWTYGALAIFSETLAPDIPCVNHRDILQFITMSHPIEGVNDSKTLEKDVTLRKNWSEHWLWNVSKSEKRCKWKTWKGTGTEKEQEGSQRNHSSFFKVFDGYECPHPN